MLGNYVHIEVATCLNMARTKQNRWFYQCMPHFETTIMNNFWFICVGFEIEHFFTCFYCIEPQKYFHMDHRIISHFLDKYNISLSTRIHDASKSYSIPHKGQQGWIICYCAFVISLTLCLFRKIHYFRDT